MVPLEKGQYLVCIVKDEAEPASQSGGEGEPTQEESPVGILELSRKWRLTGPVPVVP